MRYRIKMQPETELSQVVFQQSVHRVFKVPRKFDETLSRSIET